MILSKKNVKGINCNKRGKILSVLCCSTIFTEFVENNRMSYQSHEKYYTQCLYHHAKNSNA